MFLSESAVSAYPKLFLQQIGTIQMLSPSLRIICGDWARKLFLNIILFYLFFSTVFAGDFEIVQSSAAPVSVCPYGPSCRTGLLLCLTLPRGCSSMRTSFLQISSYFFPLIFFSFLQTFQRSLTHDQLASRSLPSQASGANKTFFLSSLLVYLRWERNNFQVCLRWHFKQK